MPLGAFISRRQWMNALTENPVLGHITTFGGHPVCCAAGLASMEALLNESLVNEVRAKEALFKKMLVHPLIRSVRSSGLLIAFEFETAQLCKRVIDDCLQKGLLTDFFLFASNCMRIAPPLTISPEEIRTACVTILEVLAAQK
jgi:acetylornithine/succinyldiaminopimelate/putrescine aminotransferase